MSARQPKATSFAGSALALLFCGTLGVAVFYLPDRRDAASSVVVSPTEIDFGRIFEYSTARKTQLTRTLSIENQGDSPVGIHLEADCGCVKLSPSDAVIAAGEQADFEVSINRIGAADRTGSIVQFSRELSVRCAVDGATYMQPVSLVGQFVEPLSVDARSLEARSFPLGRPAHSIELAGNVSIESLRVVDLDALPAAVSVDWNRGFNAGRVRLQWETRRLEDSHDLQIDVDFVDDEKLKTLRYNLPLLFKSMDPFVSEPLFLVLSREHRQRREVQFSLRKDASMVSNFRIVKAWVSESDQRQIDGVQCTIDTATILLDYRSPVEEEEGFLCVDFELQSAAGVTVFFSKCVPILFES